MRKIWKVMFQKWLSEINRDKSAPQKRKVRKRSSHGKSWDETGGRNRLCYGFSNKSVFWTRGLIRGGFCFLLLIYETVFISCLPKAKRARESSVLDEVQATNKLFLRFDQKLVNCGYTVKSYCQPVINALLNMNTSNDFLQQASKGLAPFTYTVKLWKSWGHWPS